MDILRSLPANNQPANSDNQIRGDADRK